MATPQFTEKKFLTTGEVAKLKKVSASYICRLCALPKNHPKHIKNIKINPRMYLIIDKDILDEYLVSSDVET